MSTDRSQRNFGLLRNAFVPVRAATFLVAMACLMLPASHAALPLCVMIFVWTRLCMNCIGITIGIFWLWEFEQWEANQQNANPVRYFVSRIVSQVLTIAGWIVALRLADLAIIWISLIVINIGLLILTLRHTIDTYKHPGKYTYLGAPERNTPENRIRWSVLSIHGVGMTLWVYAWRDWIFQN